MSGRIEELSKRIKEIKAERRDLETQRKELWNELTLVETELMDLLNELGLDAAKTSVGTVRLTETIQPRVSDWEQVYNYVMETQQMYLFIKRLNAASYRELLQDGITIPGTEPETVHGIGLTKK